MSKNLIIPEPGEDLLALGKRCNAVYVCPKDGSVRRGPLVAYAGKDSQERNLVGDIYFNFRQIEPHLQVVEEFAATAYRKTRGSGLVASFDTVCGIPHGGRTFGQEFARIAGKRFVYADRKPKPTEPGKKQEYDWDLSQFDFEKGERVAIAEDIVNNCQNTDSTLAQIAATGAEVVLIVCALNRSPIYDLSYTPKSGPSQGRELPLVASIRRAYPEYEQDDPEVAADVARVGIEFQVKKNWQRLRDAMQQ